MNVLVINAGSSSLKFQLLDVETAEVYAKGNCERIGLDSSFIGYEVAGGDKQEEKLAFPDHKAAVAKVFEIIESCGKKVDGIGHRVVQGGWYFSESTVITDETLAQIREVSPLAPLHNPPEADVIEICREMFPELENVAVCDTAFHHDMPEVAWRYALPRDVVDELHIRKYGMHGTSHRFIWRAAKELMGDGLHKLVSLHLGSGASLCAIQDGRSIETTMGLTPLDGLVMGTRTGTLDPATVFYLVREGGYSIDEIDDMMNKQSGLRALADGPTDTRDIEAKASAGDAKCQMALDIWSYRVAQLTCEMFAALEGVDAIAFSAGVGENSSTMRADVVRRLEWMGIKIDPAKNDVRSGEPRDISADDSKVRVLVVPTNEELMIALDVAELLG